MVKPSIGRTALAATAIALLFGSDTNAQTFDGKWQGTGSCTGGGPTRVITLSVESNAVSGASRVLGGKNYGDVLLHGQIDPSNGTISLKAASSTNSQLAGRADARKINVEGWTGESTCKYSLERIGTPTIATAPATLAPGSAPALQAPPPPAPNVETRQTQITEPPLLSNPGRDAFIARGPQEMSAVQRALAALGHYRGNIDGAYGPGTAAAIEAWQRSQQSAPTGYLTTSEVERLRGQAMAQLGGTASAGAQQPPVVAATPAPVTVPQTVTPPPVVASAPPAPRSPSTAPSQLANGLILNRDAFPVGSSLRIFQGHPPEVVLSISTPGAKPWPPEVLQQATPADRKQLLAIQAEHERNISKESVELTTMASAESVLEVCRDVRKLTPETPNFKQCVAELGQKHVLNVGCKYRKISVNGSDAFSRMQGSGTPGEVLWTGGRWVGGPGRTRGEVKMYGEVIVDSICGKEPPPSPPVQDPTANSPLSKVSHGSFPRPTCKGWWGTTSRISGQNTNSAEMRGTVTEADIFDYASRDPDGATTRYGGKATVAQFFDGLRDQVGTQLVASANCASGNVTFQEGNAPPLRMRFPVSQDQLVCADGGAGLLQQFKLMCPQAAQRMGL